MSVTFLVVAVIQIYISIVYTFELHLFISSCAITVTSSNHVLHQQLYLAVIDLL